MDTSTVYIGLDVHSRTCSICWIGPEGDLRGQQSFTTSEQNLIDQVQDIGGEAKLLALEEGPLAFWTARTLREELDQVVVCDPRENRMISRALRKEDESDAHALARLLRLGELHQVYQPATDRRALYKEACHHYFDMRDRQREFKQQIKAKLKRWGQFAIPGQKVYSEDGRAAYLEALTHDRIRTQVEALYELLDEAARRKEAARQELIELGQPYPEVQEFKRIPGIGPIGAHTFDSLIQTPHRFGSKEKLWRYCQLGIRVHQSGDAPGYEQLDPRGLGELKAVADRAVRSACWRNDQNEVARSYQRSLQRTGDATNARLNTERKVLATMWGLWKSQSAYDPEQFLG